MSSLATRVVRTVSDFTIGTVIVLIHVARADRYTRRDGALPDLRSDRGASAAPDRGARDPR